ncbi:M1 family metallopeptidase [Snuella sedimenti]|uniref:Aminopeptidase N n=1 Tax=Snuella sedimenti TaxID=2798802 RepID=A0A8J7II95_9FLAO|nr:M1 family metallopeptidase [Snuella sedimenti]MBJ6369378.1 M1 family metallopeptidase [Snuella sedimenti]
MRYHFYILYIIICQLSVAQQTSTVDFKKATVKVSVLPETRTVNGFVAYDFVMLRDADSVYIDAIDMQFEQVLLGKSKLQFYNDGKKLWLKQALKKDSTYHVSFNYKAVPKKAMYFIGWNSDADVASHIVKKQVWTQGQGKYTSNWLPSFDDMNEKVEFDLSITFDKNYEVIANGNLINQQINDSTTTWHYDMQEHMSSYLLALAIGKYDKYSAVSKSGVPLEMYYYPEDSLKMEPTYRYTKDIFDFLEAEIGVPYPWQNYKQVPVKDFLYAGMENTSLTIFSDAFVVDSIGFIDKNYVNVNAHELAHQWFGNLVTEVSGTHHWLQEGFATYYALLAERSIFGDDYYYWRLYEYAQELLQQDNSGQNTSLLDPKSSSTTFYKKGAWVLHMLCEQIGVKAFKLAVSNYLKTHKFKNVETSDFIEEVEAVSGNDLSEFVSIWLESLAFPYNDAMESLKKSHFIQEYLMVDCEVLTSKCYDYLTSDVSDEAKAKIILQHPIIIKKEDFNNGLKVRQAIAQSVSEIPLEFKADYESFLEDNSYITIEVALINLWTNFPKERRRYLNITKNVLGFNDYNIRILWLTLALLTEDYQMERKQDYYNTLIDYTSPEYSFEIRKHAFQYLKWINACDDRCHKNLNQAMTHHVWHFSKFAKHLLKEDR